jgi:hypothetical protein
MLIHKVKITPNQITHGPQQFDLDDVTAFVVAGNLNLKGYRRTSNAYCIVARIDREDWLQVLADKMHCAVADFYNRDGTGINDRWRDHYIRCYSKDVLIVSPSVIRKIKSY